MPATAYDVVSFAGPADRDGSRVALKDERLAYRACTRGWALALGLASPRDLIGRTDFDLLDREEAREQLVLDSRSISSGEARIDALRLPPGGEYAILLRLPLTNADGRVRGLDLRLLPLLPEPDAAAPYPIANYRALVNEGLQGSVVIADDAVLFANGPAARTLGYESTDRFVREGRVAMHLRSSERRRVAEAAVRSTTDGGRLVLSARSTDGSTLRLVARATRVRWGEGAAILLSFIDRVVPPDDTTTLPTTLPTIQPVSSADLDDLTGLCNRRRFEVLVREALEGARRRDERHVLCFLDLDRFKCVNDSAGHAAGDELLRQLGRRLGAVVGENDVLSRFGGDEFAVLMPRRELNDGLATAHALREEVERFRLLWREQRFSVGASVGVVTVDRRWGSASALFAAADVACYTAKREGRNRVVVHSDAIGDRPIEPPAAGDRDRRPPSSRVVSANALREALDDERVEIVCQPLTRLDHPEAPRWFELFARIRDADGSLLEPVHVLPTAERFGLVSALDAAVLRRALDWLVARRDAGDGDVRCSVNLGADSLRTDAMVEGLARALEERTLPGESVSFEIGEIAALSNLTATHDFMQRVATLGCRFGIDGFGAGLSSFTTLRRLPIDYFKIDGRLVRDVLSDESQRRLIATMIQIGHATGQESVLTAIETPEQRRIAAELGADYAQGFEIGRPVAVT